MAVLGRTLFSSSEDVDTNNKTETLALPYTSLGKNWLDTATPLRKVAGVYRIYNLNSGKSYIGISTDLRFRLRKHYHSLSKNKHCNAHLQKSYNKHGGISAFAFEILEFCDNDISDTDLLKKEHEYHVLWNVHDKSVGYNVSITTPEGKVRHSQESKDKISVALTGKARSQEHCDNIKKGLEGRPGHPHTEEHKAYMREIMKGRYVSQETRDKLSKYRTGKKWTTAQHEKYAKTMANKVSARAVQITDLENGRVFDSITQVCKTYRITKHEVYKRIKNKLMKRGSE